MANDAPGLGRRNLLKRSAGAGLVLSAVGLGMSAPAAFAADSDALAKARKDVRTSYDDAKKLVDDFGSKVTAATRDSYDSIKKDFYAVSAKLDAADKLPGDSVTEVKHAYRDIQHDLDDLDHKIDHVLSSTGNDVNAGWDDVRTGIRKVHLDLDHVFDSF
jgi:peptidoglycan hydrolase CwlO-like protein